MNARYDEVTTGVHRLNALLAWWGISDADGHSAIEARITRFVQLTSDLQQACLETRSRQLEAAVSTNDRLTHSFQDLAHCRLPHEVIAAESEILTTLLEAASLQLKAWIELTQKLQDSCVAMAREAASDFREQAIRPDATRMPAEPRQRIEKRANAEEAFA